LGAASDLLRILVVDDSPLFAEAISTILNSDPDICIVGVASNGKQAVEMTQRLRPSIITMDIQMPVMDGLEAIEHIMDSRPTPIVVVTGDPRVQGDELHFEALRRGALDVVAKPTIWEASATQQEAFKEHVKLLAGVAVVRHLSAERQRKKTARRLELIAPAPVAQPAQKPHRIEGEIPRAESGAGKIVALVASTGGPSALAQILEALPPTFPTGILVVQHISAGFASSLATWLNDVSSLEVHLAEEGAEVTPGTALLAPDGHHMTVSAKGRVSLDDSPPLDGHRPSGTLLLSSLARTHASKAVGVILTGMGKDGVEGLQAIRDAGGATVAQDEDSSVVFGMPKVAIDTGAAKLALPLGEIPGAICRLVGMRIREK
jgi:two-component system chemotaxis response regulator CheB